MSNSVPKTKIIDVSFIGSFPKVAIAPKFDKPEFAFIGRSNVGKSSLINYLCGRKSIAKTSSTPGKTQMINLFKVNDAWIIADLPGYGYARVSKKTRAKWSKMITNYLLERENLQTVFILLDLRVSPMDSDIEKIRWLGEKLVPFSIIFTKSEKLKPQEEKENLSKYMNKLSEEFSTLPNYFITSARGKIGAAEVLEYISYVIDEYSQS